MKNLKIGTKIVLGFGIVIFLMIEMTAVIIGSSIQYGNHLDRIGKVCTLQMLSNDLLDTFNDARIEARTIYHTMDGSANHVYLSHQREVEDLYLQLVAYIEESNLLKEFLPDLFATREHYLDWKTSVEDVIANNYALSDKKEQLYETGNLLGNMGALLLYDQIAQITGGAASSEEGLQESLLSHSARLQQANDIKENIYAFRLDVRALLDNYDTSSLAGTMDYIDNAIILSERFRDDSVLPQDYDNAQRVIDMATAYRANVMEYGAVCDNSAFSVNKAIPLGDETTAMLFDIMYTLNQTTTQQINSAQEAMSIMRLIVAANAFLAVVASVGMGLYIKRSIAVPIEKIVSAATAISIGIVDIDLDCDSNDELGNLAKTFQAIIETTKAQTGYAQMLAEGDLTFAVDIRSERDSMHIAIRQMVEKLNFSFQRIRDASAQVSLGSRHIAHASQSVAGGSMQQTASVGALHREIDKVSAMAENNTRLSTDALDNMKESNRLMDECQGSMERMLQAMQNIDRTSRSISSVITLIEDLSFQTDILALNAAIEAAHAGRNGKGFAVVADEVRSLASKSAKAARKTAALIEQSNLSVSAGNVIVDAVSDSIQTVGRLTEKNLVCISKVHESSIRQSRSIENIANGMVDITAIVQANAATAQQTASASEELSDQAMMLDGIIHQFRIREEKEQVAQSPSSSEPYSLPISDGFSLV